MEYFFYDGDSHLDVVEEGKAFRKVKAYHDDMMMVEVYFQNGAVGALHNHLHTQTTYCLEGSFEFTVGEERSVVKAGDTIYIPSGIVHGCKLLSEKGRLLDAFTPCREDFLKNTTGK